ncbi:MFS transporter [Fictibacillus phosphorivorans]|uniref:MFS transporter n=1 Tax=Fictibacillus phosphorivorans TaxID=1221500 RepID=A0A161TIS8_9BACL|nr:MFS transporter [Fictibacillus phosphorivorans]KZE69104.1 MFS transporter [Fictibacillus phosphorivorans]
MKKSFYYYWFSATSISLADVIYIMVITTFIYQKTESAFLAAIFPLIRAVANILAGLSAPLLQMKYSFSKLLISLQFMKAVFITTLIIGFPTISEHISYLLLLVLAISFIEGWGNPLLSSIVPKVVEKEKLVKANSSLAVTSQIVQFSGFTLTGFIVIQFGHMITLIGTAILMWSAWVCLYFISLSLKTDQPLNNPKPNSKWIAIKEGWWHLWSNKTLRLVTMMDVIEGMAGTIWVGAITLVYVKEVLHQDVQWWGYINASYYIGTILGGLFVIWLSSKIQRNLVFNMAIGSLFFSLFTLLYGLNSIPLLSLLLCVLMGPAYQLRDVSQQTAIQSNVDTEILPKVYASRSILLSTITSISIALFGFIADFLGIRWVYIIGSCLIATSALLSFSLLKVVEKKTDLEFSS